MEASAALLPQTSSAVAAVRCRERVGELPGVLLPRVEMHIVVRFGDAARGGVDVHVIGAREVVHRKSGRGVHRTVSARLRLGAHRAVLGVPAAALAGPPVALEDLWGRAPARRLVDRIAEVPSGHDAAAILAAAIDERAGPSHQQHAALCARAAKRLPRASVTDVAAELAVSERHLRRVFKETVGVTPKTFARLARFRRALRMAREQPHAAWGAIACDAGYYDQAHLIAEFRDVAGATPQALLAELRASSLIG